MLYKHRLLSVYYVNERSLEYVYKELYYSVLISWTLHFHRLAWFMFHGLVTVFMSVLFCFVFTCFAFCVCFPVIIIHVLAFVHCK